MLAGSRPRAVRALAVLVALALAAFALVSGPGTRREARAGATATLFQLNHWTLGSRTLLVRWDPCHPITYAVNVARAGSTATARSRALADVKEALSRVSRRSGLTFAYSGLTSEIPRDSGTTTWSARQKAAELVIAWVRQDSTASASNLLSTVGTGYASGTGGWAVRAWTDSGGYWHDAIGRGFVVLNAAQNGRYAPGFGAGVTRGALLLHEIGHAVGLNHVDVTSQIMYPTILWRPSAYYRLGDRQGLAKVGRAAGCIDVPASVWPAL